MTHCLLNCALLAVFDDLYKMGLLVSLELIINCQGKHVKGSN